MVRLRGDDTAVRLREDDAPASEDTASVDDGVLVHVAAPVDDNVLVYASPVLSTAVELELSSSCISQHQQLLGSIFASLRAEAQHPRSVRERWTCARNRWPWTVAPCRCGKDRFDGSVRSRLGLMVFRACGRPEIEMMFDCMSGCIQRDCPRTRVKTYEIVRSLALNINKVEKKNH